MTKRCVTHATFSIDRLYPAAPARVFKAFEDPAAKRRWFVDGEGWEVEEYSPDFRVGGLERSSFRFRGGPLIRNETTYHDIVQDERIVTAYAMEVGEHRISVSLATVQFKREGSGTRLTYTEQGAYLDGADQVANRESGCAQLLEALAAELERHDTNA